MIRRFLDYTDLSVYSSYLSMEQAIATGSVRDRIMESAYDLFYRQGYRATGINQIIAESGVAKASFYSHFPAKEDLLLAYVEEQATRELSNLRAAVESWTNPHDRFYAAFKVLVPWLSATHFRGCPFQNIVSECPPEAEAVRKVAAQHRENLRSLFTEVTRYLMKNDTAYYQLNVEEIANTYLLFFEGAIATSVAYRAAWPVDQAIAAMRQIVVSQT